MVLLRTTLNIIKITTGRNLLNIITNIIRILIIILIEINLMILIEGHQNIELSIQMKVSCTLY